jgi:hypothetical protein
LITTYQFLKARHSSSRKEAYFAKISSDHNFEFLQKDFQKSELLFNDSIHTINESLSFYSHPLAASNSFTRTIFQSVNLPQQALAQQANNLSHVNR